MDKFNDQKLRDLINESQYIIDNRVKMLNSLSEDIKNLERYLQNSISGVFFEYPISENESLLFDKRLLYAEKDWVNGKPLIECPVSVRLAMKEHLPLFLKALFEHLGDINGSLSNEPRST